MFRKLTTALGLFLAASGCSNPTEAAFQPVASSILVSGERTNLGSLGETVQLSAQVRDQVGNPMSGSVSWNSSDPAVANVTPAGLVTAVQNGSAVIEARSGTVAGTFGISVQQLVASLEISPRNGPVLAPGDTVRFRISATDSRDQPIGSPAVVWASTLPSVASVSGGLVTGLSSGVTRISARAGARSDSVEVRVSSSAGTCVDLNSAGFDDLRRIVHIDVARANQIIEVRASAPFRTVDELEARISGIGPSRMADIRAQGLACVGGGASVSVSPLEVSVLSVGQGDAIFIRNGSTKVLIDGGPSTVRMAEFINDRGLRGDTIDFMILTHGHLDHYAGFREFFKTTYGITVRRFYENRNPSSAVTLRELRDSVSARETRGEIQQFSTDDPCSNGQAICTHRLDGGALMHILRPLPLGHENDRSVAVKLIGPDSASFSMWFSGDAEHSAMTYFQEVYGSNPGLKVDVLKGNHHGSCNGVTGPWLAALRPRYVTFGVSATNSYGHVHEQAKGMYSAAGVDWLRTDLNGTVTFRSEGTPGSGFTLSMPFSGLSLSGGADRRAADSTCG